MAKLRGWHCSECGELIAEVGKGLMEQLRAHLKVCPKAGLRIKNLK